MDIFTKEKRSQIMSRIRSKDTGPEMTLRRVLWSSGLRYRVNYNIPGKPDIVFVNKRIVVFVDGCFWHGCPTHSRIPKTNKQFWEEKIKRNIKRDKKANDVLSSKGWTVLRFWEHDINQDLRNTIKKIRKKIDSAPKL